MPPDDEQGNNGETPEETDETSTEEPVSETQTEEKQPETLTAEQVQTQLVQAQIELDKAQKRISELNSESAGRRKKLEEFEKAEEERQRAQMSELEKAQADAQQWQAKHTEDVAGWESKYAELEERFNEFRINLAIEREAQTLGFANPQDALTLVDLSGLSVGDDGKVGGFEEQLAELAKSGRLPMRDAQPAPGTPPAPRRKAQGSKAKDGLIDELVRKRHRGV